MKKLIGVALFFLGTAPAALAQNVPQPPLRGVITAVTPTGMVVKGVPGMIGFAPKFVVLDVVPGRLAQVKPGSYIGTAAIKQPDGSYRAIELQIFPPDMAGVGLGTHDWNLQPHSSMTNGTVHALMHPSGTVSAVNGDGDVTLRVDDGSGEKTILLPAGAPVVSFVPGTKSDLKPGAHALIFASRTPGGELVSGRVNVGVNGLVPPM